MRIAFPFALAALLFTTGCGPDCQSSCEKLWGDGPESCNMTGAGRNTDLQRQEVLSECTASCEQALQRNGELGAYDPNVTTGNQEGIRLENEKQAAMWMDCIDEAACDKLEDGLCAPTQNFSTN